MQDESERPLEDLDQAELPENEFQSVVGRAEISQQDVTPGVQDFAGLNLVRGCSSFLEPITFLECGFSD